MEGYHAGKPVMVQVERVPGKSGDGGGLYLRTDAARAYRDLLEAAAKDGVFLDTKSTFRTLQEQVKLRRLRPRLAAPVGWSPHQEGRAIDIENAVTRHGLHKTSTYWWLKRNAGRFGFVNDVPSESWHWDFVQGDL